MNLFRKYNRVIEMKNTLIAIGEALIDFIPEQSGCDFSEVTAFAPKIGGAPANVLGAFSKLGGKTQLITQLGDDPFGRKIADALGRFNIGTDRVLFTKKANTALAFVSLDKNGDRTFSFYRNPSADMLYGADNLTQSIFDDCFALHFCSVSLGDFPMKAAHTKAIELAKKAGAIISFDPNIRLPLWDSTQKLKAAITEFLPLADIIKVSDEEIGFITGTDDINDGCRKLLGHAKIVICTCGARGAYACTENAEIFVPSPNIKATDTTGAGDAFIGSFLYSLHRGGYDLQKLAAMSSYDLAEYTKASVRYCGISVQSRGAIESYPETI